MRSEILSQEQNVIVVKAEYDAPLVTEALDGAYRELSNSVNIKGFRKGHIPKKILELHLGKAAIQRHAMEALLRDALNNILREYELSLVTDPQLKSGKFEEGSPFEVTLTLEVRPEVILPELTDIVAERTVHELTEDMVENQLARMMETLSEMKSTGEDRPLNETDIAEVEYSSTVIDADGKETELEEKKKTVIDLGQEGLRKEVRDSLIGKKPADEFIVELEVEEGHPEKRLAGKTLRYDMEVLDILRKEIPGLSDEAAEKVSQGNLKTVDALREAVRQQLSATLSSQDNETLRYSAVDKLGEACEIDIPDSMVKRQQDSMRRNQEDQIRKDLGQSLEEYLQKNELDSDEFESELEEQARRVVRNSLALDTLMEREKIGCTAEDIDREVTSMAYNMGVEPEQLKKYFIAEQSRIQDVAAQVRSRKTIDYLISKVQVVNVPAENTAAQ